MPIDIESAGEIQLLANARLAHAARRGQELADEIRAWLDAGSVRLPLSIAEDRQSWTLTWEIDPAPLEVWGFIFGDALHNLRSTLDNLLSFIARKEGITDRGTLRKVQFPIVTSKPDWERDKRHVAMLPESVQMAVELAQPFQLEGTDISPSMDLLALLQEFNNVDKHRLALSSGINPIEFSHEFAVQFEGGGSSVDGPPPIILNPAFESGIVALRWDTSPDRIATVTGKANWKAQVQITDHSGESRGVTDITAQILHYLPRVIDAVVGAWLSVGAVDLGQKVD
jgi:hypothetical protein